MSNFKLTQDQQKVLDSVSPELLVSASAGSGKTATLIEKIYDLKEVNNLLDSYECKLFSY